MKILNTYPPNYSRYKAAFPLIDVDLENVKPVFCYQDVIYNPFGRNITKDIEVHEEVHSEQQGNFPEIWHEKYFRDPVFRLNQEIEAYHAQYLFIKQFMHGRLLQWGKEQMASALSGPIYGNLCSFQEAESRIRRGRVL